MTAGVYNTREQADGQQLGRLGYVRSPASEQDDLREFLLVLRRACLMVARYVEHKYHLTTE